MILCRGNSIGSLSGKYDTNVLVFNFVEVIRKNLSGKTADVGKTAGIDKHFSDTFAVILQKRDNFTGSSAIHVSFEFQVQAITVPVVKNFKC